MTVILGYCSDGEAVMAADRMESVDDDTCYRLGLSKIRSTKHYLIGTAGDSVMCNVITHHSTVPRWNKSDTPATYFTKKLPAAWKAEHKNQQLTQNLDDVEVLIASPCFGLWAGSGTGGFGMVASGYWAIGSGSKVALGAYGAGARTPERIIPIVAEYCLSVSKEFDKYILRAE